MKSSDSTDPKWLSWRKLVAMWLAYLVWEGLSLARSRAVNFLAFQKLQKYWVSRNTSCSQSHRQIRWLPSVTDRKVDSRLAVSLITPIKSKTVPLAVAPDLWRAPEVVYTKKRWFDHWNDKMFRSAFVSAGKYYTYFTLCIVRHSPTECSDVRHAVALKPAPMGSRHWEVGSAGHFCGGSALPLVGCRLVGFLPLEHVS